MSRNATCNLFVTGFILSVVFIFLGSCKKQDHNGSPTGNEKILLEGVITGTNGIPLNNVRVNIGDVSALSDINGSFRIDNAPVLADQTFVTATLNGYFTGSRTFFPTSNGNNFIKIQLLPRTEVAVINTSTGGIANVGGASVNFPVDAFALADGSSYNGNVSVKGVYLDPLSSTLNLEMPGDLRGRLTTGDIRGLTTFGMMNIELEGSAGQKLNLKPGKSAQLSFPIPSSLSSSAPANIPLWYFDETAGIWKEEGAAQKTGSMYSGTVSHFTFWNVDNPFEYVTLDLRVLNQAQQALPSALVELTSLSDSTSSWDYTDNNGRVNGYVPRNVQLRLDIFNECNGLISSSLIGPFSTNTNLGDVQVTSLTNQQTISGTVSNCAGLPLTQGYVIISTPGNTVYANVSNGIFSHTFTNCSAGGSANLVAVDPSSSQQGNTVSIALTSTSVSAGALQTCGVTTNEFITISVDGVSRTWNSIAPYELYGQENPVINNGFYDLHLASFDSSQGGAVDINLLRSVDSINVPFGVNIQSLSIYDPLAAANMIGDYYPDNSIIQTPVSVLTEFGPVGTFIVGNFSGRFIQINSMAIDTVDVVASYRLRRE